MRAAALPSRIRNRRRRRGMKQLWDRWAPLTGVLSVACTFVGVMFVLNQPQEKDSDAKIVGYFAQHSHRFAPALVRAGRPPCGRRPALRVLLLPVLRLVALADRDVGAARRRARPRGRACRPAGSLKGDTMRNARIALILSGLVFGIWEA